MRVLGITVAALLTANSVVVAEQVTGRDLLDILGDGVDDARSALARTLDPDGRDEVFAGTVDPTTSSTAPAEVAGAVETTSTTAAGAAPESTTSSAPPPAAPGTTAPSAPRPSAAAAAPSLEQVVPQLQAFVERERGLTFKGAVPLVVLDDAAFKSRLGSHRLAPAMEEARRDQPVYRALGLIAPDIDLAAQVNRLSVGGAAAFYDAGSNELVVRQGQISPFLRKILVHELTHALDDQHFELDRPNLRAAPDDSYDAYEALVEGIAGRVEERYVAGLPDGDRKAIETEQRRLSAQIPRDLPAVVLVSFGFPYTAGVRLANALWAAGGAARFNAALGAPPSTTEQILHPEKYAAGEAPRAVPGPAADGAVVREGSLGQLLLSLMLAQGLEAGYAEGAADGWGGDRYVAWQNGGQSCVRFSIDMDNADENVEMGEALADWAAELSGTVVEGSGPFMVTRCA
ncbi:MAG TPA: hypothetical protein VI854_03655 [Acidimicrobiia bacterium]|nr:hypothetical protein [Acidimicrobiia bacterium]